MRDFEILRERSKGADRQNEWPNAVPEEMEPNFTLKLSTPPVWSRSAGSLHGQCTMQMSPDLLSMLRKGQKAPFFASKGVGLVHPSDTPLLIVQCVDFSMQGFRWKCYVGLSKEEFFSIEQHLTGIDPTDGGPVRSPLSVVITGHDCDRTSPESSVDFSFRINAYRILIGGVLATNEFGPVRAEGS